MLYALAEEPAANVRCSVDPGDPAIAVYQTPRGCAARPDDRVQALCGQHIETDGISEGSRPLVDLTEGGAWSAQAGLVLPLRLGYNALQLTQFLESPNP